jgi:hypothetical protein
VVGERSEPIIIFFAVTLNGFSSLSRLEERIEMLLGESEVIPNKFPWGWLTLTVLPFSSILLHS